VHYFVGASIKKARSSSFGLQRFRIPYIRPESHKLILCYSHFRSIARSEGYLFCSNLSAAVIVVSNFVFVGDVIVVRRIAVSCAGCWGIRRGAVRRSNVIAKPRKAKKPTVVHRTVVVSAKKPCLKKRWMITLQHPHPDGLLF
jgi:hypothetical protein